MASFGIAAALGWAKADFHDSSSTVGSILWADRTKSLPFHAYKISKTALNMLNAQYALDHADAGFTFLCVSPGVSMQVDWNGC